MLDPALRLQAATPVQVNVQNVQTLAPHGAGAMVPSVSRLEPGTAGLLSFVWPGAGQIYARQVGPGIAWMLMSSSDTCSSFSPGSFSASRYRRLSLPGLRRRTA